MTERKPPGVGWESWIERQIREGIERGEFENLPTSGKPLTGLDGPRDEDWWLRQKLEREQLSYLPPTLAIRKERDDALHRIGAASSEATVRAIVAEINERIVAINRRGAAGPPSTVMPLDVEQVVAAWRHTREA